MDKVPGLRLKLRRPFSSLLSLQVKLQYSSRALAESIGFGRGRHRYSYIYPVLMLLAFVPFSIVIFAIGDTLSSVLVSAGQPGLAVVTAVMIGQMFVLFMGISHLMSTLYYSNDLETLQALPLTPWQIMSSKVSVVYLGELFFAAIIVLPFLITLGPKLHVTEYWIYALIVFLLVPAVPIALSLLFVVLLMRVTSRSKKRDFFRVLFGLLLFVFIIGFQYLNVNLSKHGPEYLVSRLLERNGLVQAVAGFYPLLKWAAWALTGGSVMARLSGLLLYAAVSLGSLILITSLSQIWFLGGVGREVRAAKKPLTEGKDRAKVLVVLEKARSPAMAVFLRDHRILVRTPNFFLTSLLNLLVFPLILLFGYISGGKEITSLFPAIGEPRIADAIALSAVGAHGLFVGLNQIASTAISREGRLFWFSKIIPVSPREQIRGKLWYSMCYAFIQLIIMLVVLAFLLKPDPLRLFAIAALGTLLSWPISAICLLNDLYHPKLFWTEPQQAMKGNFQTLVAGLFCALYLAFIGLIIRTLYVFGVASLWLYGISFVFVVGSGVLLQKQLDKSAQKRYFQIEM